MSSLLGGRQGLERSLLVDFLTKGHQRYMYPLTVDYSHDRKEEGAVLVH